MFNLLYAYLLKQTEHSPDCKERPGFGLVCADDCGTRRLIDSLEAPLTKWEIEAEERLRQRTLQLLSGDIPA